MLRYVSISVQYSKNWLILDIYIRVQYLRTPAETIMNIRAWVLWQKQSFADK
jgi:hypothetical protein